MNAVTYEGLGKSVRGAVKFDRLAPNSKTRCVNHCLSR